MEPAKRSGYIDWARGWNVQVLNVTGLVYCVYLLGWGYRPWFELNWLSVLVVMTGLWNYRPELEWNQHSVSGVLTGLSNGTYGV